LNGGTTCIPCWSIEGLSRIIWPPLRPTEACSRIELWILVGRGSWNINSKVDGQSRWTVSWSGLILVSPEISFLWALDLILGKKPSSAKNCRWDNLPSIVLGACVVAIEVAHKVADSSDIGKEFCWSHSKNWLAVARYFWRVGSSSEAAWILVCSLCRSSIDVAEKGGHRLEWWYQWGREWMKKRTKTGGGWR